MTGLAFCARCGKRLYPTYSHKYRGYRCRNGQFQGQISCPTVTVRAEVIETAVVAQIERAAQDDGIRDLLMDAAGRVTQDEENLLAQEALRLQSTLEDLQGQAARLLDCLGRGIIAEADFALHHTRMKAEQAQAQTRLEEIETHKANRRGRHAWVKRVQQAILDFPLLWEHASFDERRHVLLSLVEALTVDRDGRDSIIRIKIHLLPEQEVRVSIASTREMKERPVGVAGLTRRQLAFLHYVGQGKKHQEMAVLMGTSKACTYQFALFVRRALGVRDLHECYVLARGRIEAQLPYLPLGPSGMCRFRNREVAALPDSLREVLLILARGAGTQQAAKRLGLTPDAVTARRKRILAWFEADTLFNAVEKAEALGLLHTPPSG